MALINCSECGKEVSDKAQSCVNCGAPVAPTISHEPNIKTKFNGDNPPHNIFIILSIITLTISVFTYIPSKPSTIFYATSILTFIFIVLDRIYVTTFYPNEDYFNPLWLLIVPAYIYKRSKYFNANLTLFWIWLIVFMVGAVPFLLLSK